MQRIFHLELSDGTLRWKLLSALNEIKMSTSINPSLNNDNMKTMYPKADILSMFETASVEKNEFCSPSHALPNLSYSFDTLETEKRNSQPGIFRENEESNPLDPLDNPGVTSFENAEGFASTAIKRRSSSSNRTKAQLHIDSTSYKSSSSLKIATHGGSKKKVKKRTPDPPDISKFFNEDSTTISISKLQQRNNRSQKWLPAPTKKVKKTFPDSVSLPAGYNAMPYGNGESIDIEAVRALVEHAQASIDPSVTLSLERTLYASLQHSWLLAVGGVGLMSVGENKRIPTNLGIALLGISILSVLGALMMHYVRLFQIKSGKTFKFWQTALFTSLVTVCILITLVLELYFGILYPYLLRTWSVQVENLDNDMDD